MKTIKTVNEIDTSIEEGRLLLAAISLITTTFRTNKTPDAVIDELCLLSYKMFIET